MTQCAEAIYANGSLTPIKPLSGIPEAARVHVTVEYVHSPSREEMLAALLKLPEAPDLADAIEAGRAKPWIPEEF